MTILWGFFSVFPANAGMIPDIPRVLSADLSVPRECGDDPGSRDKNTCGKACSPRMRG